jgi:hypothetical protein
MIGRGLRSEREEHGREQMREEEYKGEKMGMKRNKRR